MKTIALCFSTPGMDQGDFKNPDYGKKYPGAGWMRHLWIMGNKLGIPVLSGKGVIELGFDPKECHIVQEELNPSGLLLQKLGAKKTVLTCLESPIFASSFYDQVDSIKHEWKHSLLFDGGTDHLYFPSFDNEDIRDPVPWNDRKFLCMVTSNKHYSALGDMHKDSPSFQVAMKTQLHNYRYQAIDYFCRHKLINPSMDADARDIKMDLYGKGWGGYAPECENKLDTIKNYKFALCFENGSYPGYITEKIIDCFVAGVIPVYMGEPNVDVFIPSDLYIDAREFKSFQEMEKWIMSNWDETPMKLIRDIQEWLRSTEGQKYSNEYLAKRILEMCE